MEPVDVRPDGLGAQAADRFRGSLLGLACGDAVGTTVEFKPRGSFAPVTDMVGGGPFHLRPGQWTDDTSMALCLAASLAERGGFDARDQMDRYCRWYQHGEWSSTGQCFDIGVTVRAALERYQQTGQPFSGAADPRTAGNGALMRLAPIALFFFPDRALIRQYAAESARTTHAAPECLDAARYWGDRLGLALSGAGKAELSAGSELAAGVSEKVRAIARGHYQDKTEDQVRGSGYVIDSLEAALWCFWATDSFETAILKAANLGDDADTTAAICGQLAGAHYGAGGIPARWLERLTLRAEITALADQLRASAAGR